MGDDQVAQERDELKAEVARLKHELNEAHTKAGKIDEENVRLRAENEKLSEDILHWQRLGPDLDRALDAWRKLSRFVGPFHRGSAGEKWKSTLDAVLAEPHG